MSRRMQEERPFPRDPVTQVIRGAEAFDFAPGPPPPAADPSRNHGRADGASALADGRIDRATPAILFFHGWTSTPREMRFLAERFADRGYRCVGHRLKGHGLTVRALQGVSFQDHLEEAGEAFGRLAMEHDRVTLCGLSLGGLLALNVAARRRVDHLILIAPFMKPAGATLGVPNAWLVGRVPLGDMVAKDERGPIDDPAGLKDHIAYHAMPAREMASVVQGARDFEGLEKDVTCPVLILHGVHDRTSDFSGSLALMARLGSEDKTLVAFNRGNHVITLDSERARLEATALEWLDRRVHRPVT
jgi:carboxylesterase